MLFVHKGILRGLATKKDIWNILNGLDDRRAKEFSDDMLFHEGGGEEVGLLDDVSHDDIPSPAERTDL